MLEDISNKIKKVLGRIPPLGLILGSGLGDFATTLLHRREFDTSTVTGYPLASIPGHAGKIVAGIIEASGNPPKELLVFQGRIHFYESGDIEEAVFPILLAHRLGVRRVILTNASGGMNPLFIAGDLMLIRDFINATTENPLIALRRKGFISKDFPSIPLSDFLIQKAIQAAAKCKIALRHGTYCWVKGPSYETASEIRMLRRMGGDAVGMSTVPEILAAQSLGMETVAISCITNMATGLSQTKLTHAEVTETANRVRTRFMQLITALATEIA